MKWTGTLIATQRNDPQKAEIPSHRLMLRAGLIKKLASGLYTWLPLGLRVLRKVEEIVREEMDRAGALEILMPILQPKELWEKSGRWESMDAIMLKARTHGGRELVLGPTHEEVVTDLVAREISSYKQLPVNLYQINTKFRDEIRPRFGVMRCREFLMKDAYSFDLDEAGADRSYRLMYEAYQRIFERCGLEAMAVEADTGMMGGKESHEFMVPAETGEDAIAVCPGCGYAANIERAAVGETVWSGARTAEKLKEVATPGLRTVEELSGFFSAPPERFIKTLIYLAAGEPVAVLIRGDREVNESKLARRLGSPAVLADGETIRRVTGAPLGFAGPVGLKGVKILADYSVAAIGDGITGGNREDIHLLHVNIDRDCPNPEYLDLAIAAAGDPCPSCSGPLAIRRGIEVGHVFKLGSRYSRSLEAVFKDERGEERPAIMGCYGIGISRTVAAIIEQHHDEKGIIWPAGVAPYRVLLLTLAPDRPEVARAAEELLARLEETGRDVLYDDRPVSAGVKFNDADLIGIPVRITIGKKFLQTGLVEVKTRHSDDLHAVSPEEVPALVERLLGEA
jgi:prolyl-tRNA synthetase